jgi:hypothetical protein
MLLDVTLSASLAVLLGRCARVSPRRRSAPSAGWPHDRAHYFFAWARWQADELGLAVARLAVALLVPAGPR